MLSTQSIEYSEKNVALACLLQLWVPIMITLTQ